MQPLPQPAPLCDVTKRLLSTESREKIKLTSENSKENPKKPLSKLGLKAGCQPSFVIIPRGVSSTETSAGITWQVPTGSTKSSEIFWQKVLVL